MGRSVRLTDVLCIQKTGYITKLLLKDGTAAYTDREPVSLLNEWCLLFGSTIQGRIDAYKAVTGHKQKCPVLLSSASRMCVYPLYGADNEDNIWLVYNQILKVSGNNTHTEIQFISGPVMQIGCDVRIPRKQMQRCREYLDLLSDPASESTCIMELVGAVIDHHS